MNRIRKLNDSSLKYISKISKRNKVIIFIGLILVLGGIIIIIRNNQPNVISHDINEPDAPITEEVLSAEFGKDTKDSPNNPASYPSNNPINNQTSNNSSGSNTGSNSNSKPSINITSLGEVSKLEYSDDKSKMIALTSSNSNVQSSLLNVFISKVEADTVSGLTLSLADKSGNVLQTVENNKVLDAKFGGDNNYVYYQTIGSLAGIYKYDINKNKKDLITYTYDANSIHNFVLIDSSHYFFIQPNTGKMGFGIIGSNSTTLLDTKTLKLATDYANSSAYLYGGISPNKKYIVVFDKTPIDQTSFKITLLVLPTNARSLKDVIYSTSVSVSPGTDSNSLVRWSLDNKYLIVGDNSTVIDINSKKIVFSTDSNSTARISPDNKSLFVCEDTQTPTCYITDLKKSNKVTVTERVSQAEWMSKDIILIVIGHKLYIFSTKDSKLESVKNDSNNYSIYGVDPANGKAVVKQGNILINLFEK